MASDQFYQVPKPRPMYRGLDSVVHRWIGSYQRRSSIGRQLLQDAQAVAGLAPKYQEMTDHELRSVLLEYRSVFRRNPKHDAELEALAAVREAAHRTVGLRAFVVQLAGALALHRGHLVEMATGEGKTLTAGLAAVLIGWARKPFHVMTVNDYLVARDANWLTPLYEFCRIRVGTVVGGASEEERRAAYQCDVTYTTSRELLADLLRDQMKNRDSATRSRRILKQMTRTRSATNQRSVLRGIHSAVVDEADSILIDEAVTPLIISSPRPNETLKRAIYHADALVRQLSEEEHYTIQTTYKEIHFTDAGRQRIEALAHDWPGIWKSEARREELVRQALVGRVFFQKGKQYIIQDGKVVIVDEFTGRPMPQRSWRQGLHQAIEVKEGLEPSDPTETVARMSFQRFFRCFTKLSGMTGTARESAREMWRIYQLPVICLPSNKPCIRKQQHRVVTANEASKWHVMMEEIKAVHRQGRPILIGTRNVHVSEKIGKMLDESGMNYQILNATRLSEEAMIVARAGERGRITVATNMAGRGTDIKLDSEVSALGGLHVIATEPHETGRVDRQLFGRCGRQGDPGTARLFASLEDEIIARNLKGSETNFPIMVVSRVIPRSWMVHFAQWISERRAYKQRLAVLRADRWLEESLSFSGG